MRIMLCLLAAAVGVVFAASPTEAQKPGGYRDADVKNKDVIAAAEFAVKEQAGKDKGKLELVEITKAGTQVVAGTNYKLTLKVGVEGGTREALAVVWRKLDKTQQLTSWAWQGDVVPKGK